VVDVADDGQVLVRFVAHWFAPRLAALLTDSFDTCG
jgi:hypothetical protein